MDIKVIKNIISKASSEDDIIVNTNKKSFIGCDLVLRSGISIFEDLESPTYLEFMNINDDFELVKIDIKTITQIRNKKNKIEAVENFNGYKVYKIIQEGEVTFYRCSNYISNVGWDVDQMTYNADIDEYILESNCCWYATLKECRSALSEWAD